MNTQANAPAPSALTPDQFRALQDAAGLGCADLARALRLSPKSGFDSVQKMRRGEQPISGPVAVALEALASGWRPPHMVGIGIASAR